MTDLAKPALTQLEIPDYDHGLRGKVLNSAKLAPGSSAAFCTILYGLSLADDVTDTSFSCRSNGYPDLEVRLDEATRVNLPWRANTEAVIGDLVTPDGEPFGASPRWNLASIVSRYEARRITPVLGFEYEVWIFEDDPAAPRDSLAAVKPYGRSESAYSLTRLAAVASLAEEFAARMDAVATPVEAFHSELGPGLFEFALSPQPALAAADGAARARQYLRDLCAERGLGASFMAKPYGDRSGAGGHVHSSLARDGQNTMATGIGQLSRQGGHYLAGLVETLADFAVMFNPFVNSYKRLDPEMWVATEASWGLDDRRATCRAILGSVNGARVEHRRPGADATPYIVASALLAGGLAGLEGELPLPAADLPAARVASDLGGAVDAFEKSDHVPRYLAGEFVEAYAATRRSELALYQRWLTQNITAFELRRHLEHQ